MTKKQTILIVDDDESFRYIISVYLSEAGFIAKKASSGEQALEFLNKSGPVDLIISDHFMPGMNGLELLKEVKKKFDNIPFIIATAHGSIDRAVILVREGANDYLLKPVDQDDLKQVVCRCLDYRNLSRENQRLKQLLDGATTFQDIHTRSTAMQQTLKLAQKVSKSPETTIAIYGESGTGKEVLARAIHFETAQSTGPFVAVNCTAIPDGLLESELFGHVKGAFTGANKARTGKFELATGGTILLDEIGDMPLQVQGKLLRVLQEREFERTGSNTPIPLKSRVIVATHKNIEKLIQQDRFRADLFYRISVFPIVVPPLKDRKDDILEFCHFFLDLFNRQMGKTIHEISANAQEMLTAYSWPGNVRELKNCIERGIILADKDIIRSQHLSIQPALTPKIDSATGRIDLNLSIDQKKFSLDAVVDKTLQTILELCNHNKTQAAEYLGVSRKIFYRKKL